MENSLRRFRREREISQEMLAKEVGTTRQTINAIEKGRTKRPEDELMVKIENYFDVVPGTIFSTPYVKHVLQSKTNIPMFKGNLQ